MMRRLLHAALLFVLAGACSTVGVSHVEGGFAEVNASIAQEMILDNRQIIVLDFRSPEAYEAGHIAGAMSTPLDTIESRLPELLPYQRSTLLVYADDLDDSVRGARLLVAAGFRNVVRISGGLRAWIGRGYPTVSSY
jgi:rhodanese-related sulfurtransferase